jgi:hypothetical protein
MVWNFSSAINGLMFQKTILKQLNFVISINNKNAPARGLFFQKLEKQALNAQLMKLIFHFTFPNRCT